MKELLNLLILCLVCLSILGCGGSDTDETSNESKEYRTVTDMRGVAVRVPMDIQRVVDISDGFITSVMQCLGEQNKVVGVGSLNLKEIDGYTFETADGEEYSFTDGMNPVTYLNPWLKDLPAVAQYGVAVSYETVASLEPDVVIVRIGFCSLNTMEYGEEEDIKKTISTLESLGIPIVVIYGPPALKEPSVGKISEEIRVIGQVFGKEDRAAELGAYLESIVDTVESRTADIPEKEKPRVLLFGLSPNARESGGAGDVLATDTIESYFIEEIVNAKNAYQGTGGWKIMSTEQVLAINPDVIILPTDWSYHPPKELLTASYYYKNLQMLDAVQNGRVWALPWTPYNCAKRIEYPIEVMIMAKACYPELFEDIKINEWVLGFYRDVYGVDEETAKGLRTAQWLDWTVEEDW